MKMPEPSPSSRCRAALWGVLIGDALAMPVHWYYDREALARDYGWVQDYRAPRAHHPDSWMDRYGEAPRETGVDIFHDQARYWGRPGVHYHRNLRAGENTLNVRLFVLLMQSLAERGRYVPDDYLERLVQLMTTPGAHNDTYIDEYLRAFFRNLARGRPLKDCGVEEKHLSGLIGLAAFVAAGGEDRDAVRRSALAHMHLTHRGPLMTEAADLVIDLLSALREGRGLPPALAQLARRRDSDFLKFAFERWVHRPDPEVADQETGTGCFLPEALPLVLFLARKYHDRPQAGLVANANLGGNNAARGAVLGALLGMANGMAAWPQGWMEGLRTAPPGLVDTVVALGDAPGGKSESRAAL
jgi:ADP-ribosyl-[dinitrogen reductase] hydrolase